LFIADRKIPSALHKSALNEVPHIASNAMNGQGLFLENRANEPLVQEAGQLGPERPLSEG
jgi:hypothetical protein